MHSTRLIRRAAWLLALLFSVAPWGLAPEVRAQSLENEAAGSTNGVALDPTRARVSLLRAGAVVTSVVAEIEPNQVLTSSAGNTFVYDLLPTIGPGDTGIRNVEIATPAGYGAFAVTEVHVGSTALSEGCPAPGANEYCATVAAGTITLVLGTVVTEDGTRIRVVFRADAPPAAGFADFTSIVSNGASSQAAVPGDADGDPADANSIQVEVTSSQGIVLDLAKTASKSEVRIGEVVTYTIEIRNTLESDVVDVIVDDRTPPHFKYVRGSARLDGAPVPDPAAARTLEFPVGTVPALAAGDDRAEPDEPGYRVLSYQLVVGTGAKPGRYENVAVARDYCASCLISNEARTSVEVRVDPLFDLGTIIGKVYEDRDGDGRQSPGEPGIPGAFVALDNGTYALTDEFGRYHFPAVTPGYRMVKLDLRRLGPGAEATDEKSRILWATPGLMLTADFPVRFRTETETIGEIAEPALALEAEASVPPIEVQGSVDAMTVVVNDTQIPLPMGDARLELAELGESVRVRGGRLESEIRFELDTAPAGAVDRWQLKVSASDGSVVRTFEGEGAPPPAVSWDGVCEDGRLLRAGRIYAYQLELAWRDGSRAASPVRLFGVDRTTITALNLSGEAFESGKAILGERAKEVLDEAAALIRQHPDEKILIEGHTDWVGTNEYNLELSQARARAALAYLVGEKRLPEEQFALAWYGEERPIAPNDTPEGRMLNRRVVVQAALSETEGAALRDRHRVVPSVRIDGLAVPVQERGRFHATVDEQGASGLELEIRDASGGSVRAALPVPELAIEAPTGSRLVPYGGADADCEAGTPGLEGAWPENEPVATCRMRARTQPGNSVEVNGAAVEVDGTGAFAVELPLRLGANEAGVLVRGPRGVARVATLHTTVADRDGEGRLLVASEGTARLTVHLPPRGVRLADTKLPIAGAAEPGSTVTVNGKGVTVEPDGSFRITLDLPRGKSRLVIETRDPAGRTGTIEREIEVARHELFLLAFADATFGRLSADGSLEAAGQDEADEYFTEGRLAFYFKGKIAGKYLITSAFDSEKDSGNRVFGDLGADAERSLLTNLDPDKLYPVYGDASTVVWDAESRGKFYLALDSDQMHALVGNFPLSLSDTELAPFHRTLYGGRFSWQSASRTSRGEADTQVLVFGAEVRHAHVRDELRATGGSLYYLSHREIVQGSEEVTLVVRDKNTGLQLSEERQRQNSDYVIKYEEGRLMFQRPLSSVVSGGSVVDTGLLSGHEVHIRVDYETVVDSFDKTAYGGRVEQQLGDRVAVGGTYVKDELQSGGYELKGVDAEVRLGEGSRIVVEAADSTGTDALVNLSADGGLNYIKVPASGVLDGSAFKAAAELDVGEWFGAPGRYRAGLYYKELERGFASSGNFLEQGTTKMGVSATLDLTERDSVRLRWDRDEREAGGPLAVAASTSDTTTLQWDHSGQRWGFTAELFDRRADGGAAATDRTLAAGHFWAKLTEKLTARFEHQQTLSGDDNDQTSLGVDYQALPNLALELLATDGSRGSSAQAGAVYTAGESRIYLTERLAEDRAGRRTSTVLGVRAPLGESSKIYSEYQWEDADTGGKVLRLLGLQKQWDASPGLRFLLSGETADVDAPSGDSSRTTVSGGVAYESTGGLKTRTSHEIRRQSGSERTQQYFTVNQLDYRMGQDLTLLARWRYSRTENRDDGTINANLDERVVGLAWRPVRHDRFNALFKYTNLSDLRPVSTSAAVRSERSMDVFSVDTSFRIGSRIEWLAKEALRVMDETEGDRSPVKTSTYLLVQRMNLRFLRHFGLGLEYRILAQDTSEDSRQGWLAEAMWSFTENFRAGVGYNFTDFSDDVTSENDFSVQGWFVRVQARY